MIHIITSENRHLYGPQLWAMHEERRRQCVDKNGWVDLVVLDGGEIDDYDDHRAIYLLGFDDDMQLEVGLRLRPTDDRCMLADKFADLIAPGETHKKGLEVWEATRLFTTQAYRQRKGPGRGQRVFECWAAAFELALKNGVTRFVGMIDMQLYPGILNSPIETRLVGIPRPYAFGVVAGSEIAISTDLLEGVLEAIGRESPVGYEIDALDLMAFGNLAAVQRQVKRAMTPQLVAGPERDETLAAETLFRLHDTTSQARRIWDDRASRKTDVLRLDA
ncbi:N-acyl-L-homoserine lactone synthetase [Caulobacter vibrioides]|uniref:N-acyl-L-homoserine lactone synthetase n=1 Tax=Caulobacter vibrioides TaxID=155892 RepID=A0A290MQB9_CAUVI|nr:acyl-homoserine-lactone synthase [Caulobacter vibrioides]ATC34190.1 N-acyl-L-homoserine lactone synthetase [Caulobacter vibrioides]